MLSERVKRGFETSYILVTSSVYDKHLPDHFAGTVYEEVVLISTVLPFAAEPQTLETLIDVDTTTFTLTEAIPGQPTTSWITIETSRSTGQIILRPYASPATSTSTSQIALPPASSPKNSQHKSTGANWLALEIALPVGLVLLPAVLVFFLWTKRRQRMPKDCKEGDSSSNPCKKAEMPDEPLPWVEADGEPTTRHAKKAELEGDEPVVGELEDESVLTAELEGRRLGKERTEGVPPARAG